MIKHAKKNISYTQKKGKKMQGLSKHIEKSKNEYTLYLYESIDMEV